MAELGIVAQQALLRSNVALSVIKSNAQAQQSLANVIAQTAASVPVSSSNGTQLDIRV